MKAKKITAFALIALVPMSLACVGVLASQSDVLNNLVNAGQNNENCVIEFSNKNEVTLDETGAGTSVSSTLQLSYKNAAKGAIDEHVVLNDGGEMFTNGKKYDSATQLGSVTNGLKTVKVFFEADEGATLTLSTSRNGTYDEGQVLNSGDVVNFTTNALPKLFKLKAEGGAVHIKSVQIVCTMVEDYVVNVFNQQDMQLDWHYLESNGYVYSRGEAIEDISTATFEKGDKIGFKVSEGTPVHVLWGDFTYEGVTVARTTIGDDTSETFYFDIKDEDVNITFTRLRGQTLYEGRDFVGTWNVYNIKDKTNKTLELTKDGYVKFDGKQTYYSADENDKLTFDKLGSNVLTFYLNNDVCLFKNGYSDSFVGVKTNPEDVVTLNASFGSGYTYVAQFDKNGTKINVLGDSDKIVLEGGEENVAMTFNTDNAADSTVLTVKAIPVDGENSILTEISSYYTVKESIDGVMTHTLYAKLTASSVSYIKVGDEKGTYTGPQGDLNLDGLGSYTLGETNGTYTFDKTTGVVTLKTDGSEDLKLQLNLEAKTYEVYVSIDSDPWTDKPYTYVGDKFDLTFENGKVTINPKDGVYWWDETASYSVANSTVTFKLDDNYYTYTFKFAIDSSLNKITLSSFSSNGWGGDVSYSKGMVLTLQA